MKRLFLVGTLVILTTLSPTLLISQTPWTLGQCIERAWDSNLDIERTEMFRDMAEIDLKQSRFSQFPSLNAGATHGYNWGQTIDPFTNEFATDRVRNNNLFLSSEMVLFRGMQIRNSIKQSKIDLEASAEDLKLMRNDMALLVAQSFLNVLFNKEQVKAAEEQVSISERQVTRMERMFEVGQEAEAGLLEVRSQLATDVLNLTQIENSLMIARLTLTNLLLLGPQEAQQFEILAPSDSLLDMERPIPEVLQVYSTAVQNLPQIKAAELRVESSEVGMDIAQGGRSPQLSVRGSIGSGYSGNNQVGVG
ncbi:MAG: TolC family protein, partial [Flavobacteriales bacterium]|nr:TolC family protein [Flavobacteriales bacterium]